jgi:hydrophobe/amphiphile efflux-1 (HAE1) family protein
VLVLNAVFLPVAFLGGLVGEMYRQFAITIAVSVTISGFVALTLTPAMCAILLKTGEVEPRGLLAHFDAGFQRFTHAYMSGVRWTMRHGAVAVAAIALMAVAIWWLERSTPSALAPNEDQGYVLAIAALPPAASLQRTKAALDALDQASFAHPAYDDNITVTGFDVLTNGQRSNAGVSFVLLKDWSERHDPALSADAVAGALFFAGLGVKDAAIFSLSPPAVEGMSNTGGFGLRAVAHERLRGARASDAALVAAARGLSDKVGHVVLAQVPRERGDRSRRQAAARELDDVNVTLQSTFGAFYVNDFNRDGRVYRVQMQSDGRYRTHPEDLRDVPCARRRRDDSADRDRRRPRDGSRPHRALQSVSRPRACSAARAGTARAKARGHGGSRRSTCPTATRSRGPASRSRRRSGQITLGIFALAVLMVFLILAAQYERITLPFAVILAVPFAVFGAFLAVWLRGLYNDLYLQIGLVTLVGLAAKNAILIVEFAAHIHREGGKSLAEAAIEAARLRFRPIVMTSLAFILGVVPLALSTGAGAGSRHSIGTGVIGGMLAATFIAVLFIPLFFVWTSRAGDAVRRRFGFAPSEAP